MSPKEWILLTTWKQTYLSLRRVLLFDEKLNRATIPRNNLYAIVVDTMHMLLSTIYSLIGILEAIAPFNDLLWIKITNFTIYPFFKLPLQRS